MKRKFKIILLLNVLYDKVYSYFPKKKLGQFFCKRKTEPFKYLNGLKLTFILEIKSYKIVKGQIKSCHISFFSIKKNTWTIIFRNNFP